MRTARFILDKQFSKFTYIWLWALSWWLWGHDLSEFYEGGLEKGGFSKLNLRKVRRRPGGGGGGVDEH